MSMSLFTHQVQSPVYVPNQTFSLSTVPALAVLSSYSHFNNQTQKTNTKMKLSAVIALSFLSSALAAGPADNVNAVLKEIQGALSSFDTVIKAYSGGPGDALTKANKNVEDIIGKGAKSISAGADLTLNDAVSITATVQGLQSVLETTLKDLESAGPKLAAAGECSSVTSQLAAQKNAANSLEAAITGKTPPEARSIAKQLGGQVGAAVTATQGKFTTICANAPKGAPASGASGGASVPTSGTAAGGASGAAAGASSGSTGSKTGAGTATSSSAPAPKTFTGSGNSLQAAQGLAFGVAAAFFAL